MTFREGALPFIAGQREAAAGKAWTVCPTRRMSKQGSRRSRGRCCSLIQRSPLSCVFSKSHPAGFRHLSDTSTLTLSWFFTARASA
jgi:hypothetical protein